MMFVRDRWTKSTCSIKKTSYPWEFFGTSSWCKSIAGELCYSMCKTKQHVIAASCCRSKSNPRQISICRSKQKRI